MSISRRGFLSFAWREKTSEDSGAEAPGPVEPPTLPPEFDGPMLRMEGRRLGLNVDEMSETELVRAIMAAMAAGAPDPGPSE